VGYALVLTGAVMFILNAGVARATIRGGVDPGTLTTVRVTGSAVVYALWAVVADRSALRPPRGRMLGWMLLMGIVGVALLQWTYLVAIDRLPIGIALLLEYTAPVLIALWARFVAHEPVGRAIWPALGLALGGLALVAQVWDGLAFDGLGVLAGLAAAVCFATFYLVGEHGISEQDPIWVVLWSFVIAAVALNLVWPITDLTGDDLTRQVSLGGELAHVEVPGWALLLWIVVPGSVAPFALTMYALRHLPATVVSIVSMAEPIGVAALGWAWFGESLTPVQLLGGVAVLAGILLAQRARQAPHAEAIPPP
jgi:drug/metabolite transporter (DMT)-like permease